LIVDVTTISESLVYMTLKTVKIEIHGTNVET